jgi:hypothetical protein
VDYLAYSGSHGQCSGTHIAHLPHPEQRPEARVSKDDD